MIRLETLLLLGIGIALVPRSTDGQRGTFPRRSQSDICRTNQNQEWPNCCDGFLMCSAAGAVGNFMRCAEGTLFDNNVGFCNAITDLNRQCHRCFNNQRQGLRNNLRNNNRRPNGPRRAQFRNTNSFNTLPPPFTTNNNQQTDNRFARNPFQNPNNRFNVNRNQNRFNGNPNQNRINGNRNQNNRFSTRNQNTEFTTRIPNNRFGRTQNNRFQTNTRNRFNTIRFTTPNGNRGTFQAPERIQLTIRDVRPSLRGGECVQLQAEMNRQLSRLTLRLGTRRVVPVFSIQCQTRQNTRG